MVIGSGLETLPREVHVAARRGTSTASRQEGLEAQDSRLVIVSNRLPIVVKKDESGEWQVRSGSGGLVTALAPVLRHRGGLWIGWPGAGEEVELGPLLADAGEHAGYTFRAVNLTQEEVEQYYLGFSNETLWPLFHDLQSRCTFEPRHWQMYQAVNRKFAQIVAQHTKEDDHIWVQDYHLLLVAKELRAMGVNRRLLFFLHTPFPPLDIFMKLPWRAPILRAMLEYDLIGFQTLRDRNNFMYSAESLIKGLPHLDARRRVSLMPSKERETRVGIFPISIDFHDFASLARDLAVTQRVNEIQAESSGCKIVLGVDRLDYSKGIPLRLQAYKNLLERFEELCGKITFIQIIVPSRVDIPEYQKLKVEIEGLVGEINGKFSGPGWTPVQYMFRSLERPELLAYYRAAHTALVTPLKDGMNLIAKEYCAANVEQNGVLILSEFAGAASQLRGNALLVNPYDIEGVANAIQRAYHMGTEERRCRMRRLRNSIHKHDIFWWVERFLEAASQITETRQREETELPTVQMSSSG